MINIFYEKRNQNNPIVKAYRRIIKTKPHMTISEFQLLLGISPKTMYRWISEPQYLPKTRILRMFEVGAITFDEYKELTAIRNAHVKTAHYGLNLPTTKNKKK